ncbi:MAG: TIGR03619 family F420-dependent LLM class oxidoreductase [Acidimicrobiales bacterium]
MDAIVRAARQAEDLGFADVWVSDHVAVPRVREYPPSAYIHEPLVTMAVAATATTSVGIGTSVLVVPMRQPVLLAKQLASIDVLSGGRVILGAAAGWLEAEFRALGTNFDSRGEILDESIDLMRAVWTEDPIYHDAPVSGVELKDMRTKPQPAASIPIWIGGHSPPVYRRAIEQGDGWHGAFKPPSETKPIVELLRRGRPEPDFVLSMRTGWDALEDDHDRILSELEEFHHIGIQHIVAEPRQRTIDDWLRGGEALAELYELASFD